MVDDKLVRRSFWVGEIACSSRAYHKTIILSNQGLMAEWFKRGTVNTFYRGSNPLKTFKIYF